MNIYIHDAKETTSARKEIDIPANTGTNRENARDRNACNTRVLVRKFK